eukprot:171045_1
MSDKTIIYCQANILSISDVDTVSQTYNIEAVFKLRWKASVQDQQNWNIRKETESKQDSSSAPNELVPSFVPKITFPNATACEIMIKDGVSQFFKVERLDEEEGDMIVYDFQIRCAFAEPFQLKHFPFDCQDLPIMMKMGNKGGTKKYVLMPDILKKNFGKVDLTHCMVTQWRLHPTLIEFGHTDPALSKSGDKAYPVFILRVKAQRRYQFYVQRIALILAALSLSSLTAYAVDVDEVADRLGIDFTLLLTIVAFQQTVTDSLPVLSFVTVMDKFVLVSIGFVFAVTVQHALMPSGKDELDRMIALIFGIVWLVIHIGFGIYCPTLVYREKKKLTMNTQQLKQYFQEEGKPLAHKFETNKDHIKKIESEGWVSFLSKVD